MPGESWGKNDSETKNADICFHIYFIQIVAYHTPYQHKQSEVISVKTVMKKSP